MKDYCVFVFSDIQQILSDPMQAVNDAVDEVSSLFNKFQGTEDKLDTVCSLFFTFQSKHSNTELSFPGLQNVHRI